MACARARTPQKLQRFRGVRGQTPLQQMIAETATGVVISVRVIPRANRSAINGTRGDALLVRLKAPPVDGAANAELIRVIAAALDVPARHVSLAGGEHSRQKRVAVAGMTRDAAHARLLAAAHD